MFGSAGDDQWVAVTVRDNDDWRALCSVIGRADLAADDALSTRAGRARDRARIDDAVGEWTAGRSPTEAMTLLQRAGVPAGAALRAAELPGWDYYVARRAFREELHPLWTTPFVMENVQIHSERIADPPLGQAPLLGEQTRELGRRTARTRRCPDRRSAGPRRAGAVHRAGGGGPVAAATSGRRVAGG